MELVLQRDDATAERTIGHLFVDKTYECFVLEPPLAALNPLEDHPAIAAGRYPVRITRSQRFQKMLPEIYGVPGRSGIRVHSGNSESDTSGCLLVGMSRQHDSVLSSQIALAALQPKIAGAQARHEDVWITILDPLPTGTLRA